MVVLLPVGQIIVSKVFVGQSMPVKEGEPVDRSSYPKMCSVYCNVNTDHRTAMSEGIFYIQWHENNYVSLSSCTMSLHVCVFHLERHHSSKALTDPGCSPRRRQWFVFDHELVLPEYIIYFEYIIGVIN